MTKENKDFNTEVEYYLKSIGKTLINIGDEFDITKYKEITDFESCDLIDLIEYTCVMIAMNGDYRKNPIHFFIKDLKSENHWQRQLWKIIEKTAQNFVLHFARLRRNRLHKDVTGKSFGNVLSNNVHINTKI